MQFIAFILKVNELYSQLKTKHYSSKHATMPLFILYHEAPHCAQNLHLEVAHVCYSKHVTL